MAHDKTLRFTVDLRSLDTVRLGQVARDCMVISPSWDSTEWWVHRICERILTPIFMGCATFTYLQDRFSPIHFPCFSLLPKHFTDLVWITVFIITSGEPYRRTLMTTQVNPLTLPEPANGTAWPVASRWRDEKKKASKRWLKLGCIVWRVSILESCTSASLTLNLNSYVRSTQNIEANMNHPWTFLPGEPAKKRRKHPNDLANACVGPDAPYTNLWTASGQQFWQQTPRHSSWMAKFPNGTPYASWAPRLVRHEPFKFAGKSASCSVSIQHVQDMGQWLWVKNCQTWIKPLHRGEQ